MKYLFFITLSFSIFISCKKSEEEEAPIPTPPDIYVVGSIGNGLQEDAVLWKNGIATYLANGSNSAGVSVVVNGNDVYIAGQDVNTNIYTSFIWKNNVHTKLADSAYSTSVYVGGSGDVYVTGCKLCEPHPPDKYEAILWKNGTDTDFLNDTNNACAAAVAVSGNDVYVAGAIISSNGITAKLWKNGIDTHLVEDTVYSTTSDIFVSGSDVYVVGRCKNDVAVWKNGMLMNFPFNSIYGNPRCIYVSGTDVYVAGSEPNSTFSNDIGKLWKNGISIPLPNINIATSVFVSGTDVYLVGYSQNGNRKAKLWKNGEVSDLSPGSVNSTAYSIFVKEN